MPDLFKDIVSENTRTPADGCGIVRILETMEPEDRSDLEQALANRSIASSAIDRALRKHGYSVSGNMVRRHRRKDCSCGKNQ